MDRYAEAVPVLKVGRSGFRPHLAGSLAREYASARARNKADR